MRYVKSLMVVVVSLIALLMLEGCACKRVVDGGDEMVMATVGKKKLLKSDVEAAMVKGLEREDSLRLLESIIDGWVKKELKVAEAEKVFGDKNREIERLIDEYRSSLLTRKLEQYHFELYSDTIRSETILRNYFEDHKEGFVLDREIVKGKLLRIDARFEEKNRLKRLMVSSGDQYQDFMEICNKNDFELKEYDKWIDLMAYMQNIPAERRDEVEKMVKTTNGVVEIEESGEVYFIYISDLMLRGETMPFEKVEDQVREIVGNKARKMLITTIEDSLYRVGSMSGVVKIAEFERISSEQE